MAENCLYEVKSVSAHSLGLAAKVLKFIYTVFEKELHLSCFSPFPLLYSSSPLSFFLFLNLFVFLFHSFLLSFLLVTLFSTSLLPLPLPSPSLSPSLLSSLPSFL